MPRPIKKTCRLKAEDGRQMSYEVVRPSTAGVMTGLKAQGSGLRAQGSGLTLACKKVLNDLDHRVMNMTVRRDQISQIEAAICL